MLSVCITVKNRSRVEVEGGELRLLPACIKSIAECAEPDEDIELVIADWHSDDWPLEDWAEEAARPVPLTLVTLEGYFSRGKGLNAAADAAKGDVLLFLDADMLVPRELIDKGRRYVADGKAFYPICYTEMDPDGRKGRWRASAFGNVMLSRDRFLEAGKWPELKSWGREDNSLHDAVKRLGPVVRENVPSFRHQWHPNSLGWKNRYADPRYRKRVGAK